MGNNPIRSALLALALVISAAAHADETPEERMQRRFPQPVKVGDLIGLPVYDDSQSTLGHVREVVRTPAGKISVDRRGLTSTDRGSFLQRCGLSAPQYYKRA